MFALLFLLLSLRPVFGGVCDLFASGGTPCVGAFSLTRALYAAYDGPLYTVLRSTDNATFAVGLLKAGGVADAASQDTFCASAPRACVILGIFDQSPQGNHLAVAPENPHSGKGFDRPCNATALRASVTGGHAVYGALFQGRMGYRNDTTTGVATGNNPETIYMVTSGTASKVNTGCCMDFGNAEKDNTDDGSGTMEALYMGYGKNNTKWSRGSGSGPWVYADLENGLWAGNTLPVQESNVPITTPFVTAILVGRADGFALAHGDATRGVLTSLYDGPRPNANYSPMRLQGGIIIGVGGDNSGHDIGAFFEGAITKGAATSATLDAVQKDIVSAGYA